MRKFSLDEKEIIAHRSALENTLKEQDGNPRVYQSSCASQTFGERNPRKKTECTILTGDQELHLFLGSLGLRGLQELCEILNISFWPEAKKKYKGISFQRRL